MEELVKLDENNWHARENTNHIQLLQKYQQDDKSKMKHFNEGELVLWMLKTTKIKGKMFKLLYNSHTKSRSKFK
jgi:hypothetical protein